MRVQIEPTLSAGCTPGEKRREGETERGKRRRESG